MPPILPPVDVLGIFLTALLNPAVPVVAVLMGMRADQWQKIPLAGFAAAVIGTALVYVLVRIGGSGLSHLLRAPAGLLIVQFAMGTVWAGAAYLYARRMPR